jgi:hypothetical protein
METRGASSVSLGWTRIFGGDSPREKHSQDAEDASLSLLLIEQLAKRAHLGSGVFGAPQELRCAQRHFLGVVFFLDAISRMVKDLKRIDKAWFPVS